MKPIPQFNDIKQESDFWMKEDSTEYIDWSKAEITVFTDLKPTTKSISLRLPESMLAQQAAIDITNNFISELKSIGLKLRNAYLFGSYVSQKQHEHSDIDVAIIADEFTGIGPIDIKLFISILRKYKLIHVKTFTNDDTENGNPFLEEVKENGLKLI